MFLVLKCSLCCRSCAVVLRITAVYKEAQTAEERKVPCLPAGPEASAKRSSQLPALLGTAVNKRVVIKKDGVYPGLHL